MGMVKEEEMNMAGLAVAVKEPETLATTESTPYEDLKTRLGVLGFTALERKVEIARKLAIAYAKYGYVTKEAIAKFNEKLEAETKRDLEAQEGRRRHISGWEYKQLVFTPIGQYGKIPPHDALRRLEAAVNDGIFDEFKVGHIQWVKEIPDPILFGRIVGCEDLFFIAQWDDDVKIEDIVNAGT